MFYSGLIKLSLKNASERTSIFSLAIRIFMPAPSMRDLRFLDIPLNIYLDSRCHTEIRVLSWQLFILCFKYSYTGWPYILTISRFMLLNRPPHVHVWLHFTFERPSKVQRCSKRPGTSTPTVKSSTKRSEDGQSSGTFTQTSFVLFEKDISIISAWRI